MTEAEFPTTQAEGELQLSWFVENEGMWYFLHPYYLYH